MTKRLAEAVRGALRGSIALEDLLIIDAKSVLYGHFFGGAGDLEDFRRRKRATDKRRCTSYRHLKSKTRAGGGGVHVWRLFLKAKTCMKKAGLHVWKRFLEAKTCMK